LLIKRNTKIFIIAAGVIITPVLLSPLPRFDNPLSTVVEASDGTLLGARIADDGQWRFPDPGIVPDKYEKALITFEDKYFYFHPGINPVSVIRALLNNLKAGEIVSGGSTITMQVARLSRGNMSRNYTGKIIEMLSAVKLEISRTKKEIIRMYSANAPFGGNIVGLEAATWRYTGKSSSDLSWAEAATFAVLPNSPSLVFPGKNQEILRLKRDNLLRKLHERKYFDSLTLELALDEPLPGAPVPLPGRAPHLTDFFYKNNKGRVIRTTIDHEIQERVSEILYRHQLMLSGNFIHNSACIIVKVETGEVIAYVGNTVTGDPSSHAGNVDITRAPRSTGSILKPFLYAAMQYSGHILPNTLIADVPTRFNGFTPVNFDMSYSGAVAASMALSQSLNIPAVKMLQQYTAAKFLNLLGRIGFSTFTHDADFYGLSLILGGGETSLWELTGAYASLSRMLNRFNRERKYYREDIHPPVLLPVNTAPGEKRVEENPPLSAASIWLTYEALKKVNRPEGEAGWQYFSSSSNLAWKTGTSFGFRDAWAVGTTPAYVIGVWAGNADGEGRPGLTGITAAAPLLFDIVNMMGTGEWFEPPYEELTPVKVCALSGFRAGIDCPETLEVISCIEGLRSETCPFHQLIHLDSSKSMMVNADCYPADKIKNEPWFVLPPAMEYFYRQKHPGYKVLPPGSPSCRDGTSIPNMEFIYPSPGIKIFIPRDETGASNKLIPEIAHRVPSRKIFWHLDKKYIGTTRFIHQQEIFAGAGEHVLTVVDEEGNRAVCSFTIVTKQ
jgi:penicillin-binding protein 1C